MENWTLTWTKLSSLDEASIKKLPDKLAGVYRLSYKADDGEYYVFYIDQSEDIKKMLLQHLSDAEDNVCVSNYLAKKDCYFRYAIITKSDIRNAAEKQMYKQYEPVCNDKEPEGRDDIKVNLN